MIGIVRDTWRAVLFVVVAVLLREVFAERAPPAVVTHGPWQPAQVQAQPVPVWIPQTEPPRPLRRVGSAFVELADSVIGVVRR